MASTSPIAPELECEERSELIQQLSDLLQLEYVDSATYAMLWFADVEAIRTLVSDASKEFTSESTRTTLQNAPHMRYLKMWLGRRLSASQVPETPDPPVAESSQSSRKRPPPSRSGNRSKLPMRTSPPTGPPSVPRDYDDTVLEPPEKNFWSSKKVAAWQRDIFSDRGTEVCQNLLTFNTLAHDLWGLARFALEPVEVSEDQKTITVRFWWLPRHSPRIVRMTDRPSLPSDLESGPGKSLMTDCETETFIRSGHLITMTTEDPETMPLPSLELLGMHWVLTRVAALAGAAEATDVEFDEESDEDFEDFRIIER
ncbi:hypothetical protein HFD88_007277 [Aspergillus terreus]|nr:hypothetical protein HFD88_007277 [Aspergillus terreus]